MKVKHANQAKDFPVAVRRALAAKGIAVVGSVWLPASSGPMPMANGETGYRLDDNGTNKIRDYPGVWEIAGIEFK